MKTIKALLVILFIFSFSIAKTQTNLDVNNINAKTGNFSNNLNVKNLSVDPSDDGSGGHIYTYHKLTIGSAGYAHNDIEIKSAGGIQGPTYTSLGLYATPSPSAPERIILFNTSPYSKSYINSGYLGINTSNPEQALDVKGTTRTDKLEVFDQSENSMKSVLARLPEGINSYLTVNSYSNKTVYGKAFSIEHKFQGNMNNAINFYRGGDAINGGTIGIVVNSTTEMARFHENGLDIKGTILANEVRIETGWQWPDYVFDKDYELPTLEEVANHIEEHKHLPGIPSEKEVKENGIDLSEMTTKMMQKIEELTLYVIKQDKKIKELEKQIKDQ